MTKEIITNFEHEDEQILYGLDAWTQLLSTKELPARASSLKRLKMLLHSDRSTIGQLELVIKRDPVLTLYVVRAAQLKHNAHESAVKSILHAVTSLGYDGIEEIANRVEPMSLNPTNVQQKRFLHALAASQHAASQLQEWMHFKNIPLVEESYLAALFYSIGFWSLWLHAPLHMQQIQKRIHEKNEEPMDVENDVLGCSMQMISQGLAKIWQLSDLTQQAQDHSTSPSFATLKKLHKRALKDASLNPIELRELNHITQQKYFPIKLANWLALDAARDWHSEKTSSNIDLVGDYLGTAPEKTVALIHKTCAKSSREYFAPGIMSPACVLLFIPSDMQIQYKMGAKEHQNSLTMYPSPEKPMIKPIDLTLHEEDYSDKPFYDLIEAHFNASKEKSKFSKPTQVLLALSQGLQRGLDIQRLSLFSVSKKNDLIKPIQNLGFNENHAMLSLHTKLSSESALQDICKRQSYFVCDPLTAKKYSSRISSQLQSASAAEFMFISIFKVNQLVGIIYIDMKDAPLSNFTRERTRHLCLCACTALENI
jgi:HD-like signal output (HDOD) protein